MKIPVTVDGWEPALDAVRHALSLRREGIIARASRNAGSWFVLTNPSSAVASTRICRSEVVS